MPTVPIPGTRLLVLLEDPILAKIDRFRAHRKLQSRTHAIRLLIAIGLDFAPQEEEFRAYVKGNGA